MLVTSSKGCQDNYYPILGWRIVWNNSTWPLPVTCRRNFAVANKK